MKFPLEWRRGIAWRFVAGSSITAVLAGVATWGIAARVSGDLRSEARLKVAGLAATIAAGISGSEHGAIQDRIDGRDSTYMKLLAGLVSARQANPSLERAYTLSPDLNGRRWHFVLVSETDIGAPARARAGDGFNVVARPEVRNAFQGATADRAPTRHGSAAHISGYAPIRDRSGVPVAVVGVDVDARDALAAERVFRLQAAGAYVSILVVISFVGWNGYRRRRQEMERARNVEVRLSIHRLAEVMTRTGTEADLARNALDVIAEGTGHPSWALFKRNRERGSLEVFATRSLPDGAESDIAPDPVGKDARSPASLAAYRGEVVVARGTEDVPQYPFAAGWSGVGPDLALVAVPIVDHGETTAVLQCFAPRARGFRTDDITLIRWMASQVSLGLKRIQLEQRDQLLASYMRGTEEMLIGFNLDGVITYANPAAERELGDPESRELRGRRADDLFRLPDAGEDTPFFSAVRAAGGYSGDVTCLRSDQTSFPAEVTISRASDRDGGVSAMVLIGRNATERREREAEIRSRSEQLQLINEQLQHANEELASANRMKNEFLANTSHELRTPLNAVIGFASLIEQGATESEEERRTFARSIRESAEHLLTVINDILDLAKVEAGRLEVALEAGDVTPSILAAVDAVRPAAARKGLKLLVDTAPDPLDIELDPARMRQILLNLLGNAIKFTDKGEVRIRAWPEPDHGEVRILIEDTGIGIAKEQQPRLFVKFSQVDGSYKRRRSGTGLGLVITQSLVARMGGRLAMASEGLGMGTRVTLAFPAAKPQDDPPEASGPGALGLDGVDAAQHSQRGA